MMQGSDELAQALERLYDAFTGNVSNGFEALLSQHGPLFIGTAPEEWWEGHDEIARVVRAQAEALGQGEIVGSNPAIREMGDVAWTADRLTMRLADGTEVPLRLTTTWCREDGVWKMVQGHTSVGIGNADAFNKDVTL